MRYDPTQPHHLRYIRAGEVSSKSLCDRVAKDSLALCRALGIDFNTLEFAVHDEVPYVIDCVNPASDADMHLVGKENFDWAVENIANLAIQKALSSERPQLQYRWFHLLDPDPFSPEKNRATESSRARGEIRRLFLLSKADSQSPV